MGCSNASCQDFFAYGWAAWSAPQFHEGDGGDLYTGGNTAGGIWYYRRVGNCEYFYENDGSGNFAMQCNDLASIGSGEDGPLDYDENNPPDDPDEPADPEEVTIQELPDTDTNLERIRYIANEDGSGSLPGVN